MIHDIRHMKLTGKITASVSLGEGNVDVINTVRCGPPSPVEYLWLELREFTRHSSRVCRSEVCIISWSSWETNQEAPSLHSLCAYLPMKSLITVFSVSLPFFLSDLLHYLHLDFIIVFGCLTHIFNLIL